MLSASRTVGLVFSVWSALYVASRVTLFFDALKLSELEIGAHKEYAHLCATHAIMRREEPDKCKLREALAAADVTWMAVGKVLEQTSVCGFAPCLTIFEHVVDAASKLTLYAVGGVVAALVLLRVVAPLAVAAMRSSAPLLLSSSSRLETATDNNTNVYARNVRFRRLAHVDSSPRIELLEDDASSKVHAFT